jgi:pentatricopeptide repeat protein
MIRLDGQIVQAKDILEKIEKLETVEYDHVIVEGDLDLDNLDLQEDFIFKTINPSIRITHSEIRGYIKFNRAIFRQPVDFEGTIFSKFSDFGVSRFESRANFDEAEFRGEVTFWSSKFCSESTFRMTRFISYANFFGSRFCKEAYFAMARFDGKADFDGATFKNEANFGGVKFEDNASFFAAIFEAPVFLSQAKFSVLEIRWNSIKDHLVFDGQFYQTLIKNYGKLGWFDDADQCYYHYRTMKRANLKGGQWILDCIAWIAYGYGIRFYYPLFVGVILFFIFSGIFLYGKQANSISEALDLSAVILTTTTQVGNLTGTCRFWSLVERLLGWLLMSSFLVVLVKQTIR